MVVYRIERQDGWGAFCNEQSEQQTIVSYPSDSIYANEGCTVMGVRNHYGPWRFGCETLDGLVEYFGSDFAKLIGKHGCSVVAYKVHKAHVRFGLNGCELAFIAEKAERIN